MSDLPVPANGAAAGERPPGGGEWHQMSGASGDGRRTYGRIAFIVVPIFWAAQFTFLTVMRLVRMPDESLGYIPPRAVVACFAILLSFGLLALLRAAGRQSLLRRALLAVGLALLGATVHAAINAAVFVTLWGTDSDSGYLISWLTSITDFFWWYSALCFMLLALTYGEDLVEHQKRIASLEARANMAQLNALRYQLNPHFLFNTLNSVASLISKQRGAEAEAMVVSLSDFLRSTLRMDSGREITLAEEIKLQSLYLDIEKIRFPQRLNVTIDVPAELGNACVPNLITQPLIENAIKHGVARSAAPVHLEVIAREAGDLLSIEVRDDGGDAGSSPPAGTQVGLRNVAERLRLRFGDEAGFAAGPRPDGGFSARIRIPLRRAAE